MSYFPLEAHYVGRARGCRNMTVVIENGVLFASAPAGPRVSIQVGRLIEIHNPRRGDRVPIPYYNIDCVLANGTPIDCEGYMYSGSTLSTRKITLIFGFPSSVAFNEPIQAEASILQCLALLVMASSVSISS